MGSAVVLGEDLAEAAGPVCDGAAADPAARDGKMGNGRREAAGTGGAYLFYDASPAEVTLRAPRARCAADEAPVGWFRSGITSWIRGGGGLGNPPGCCGQGRSLAVPE